MNKEKRIYSSEERSMYLAQWQQSGLLKSEFARNNNISYTTFVHWISGRKKKGATKDISSDTNQLSARRASSFVSVQVESAPTTKSGIPILEITLANGSQISFYQTVPIDYLRELLK